jgi:uncharacterized membrane protein
MHYIPIALPFFLAFVLFLACLIAFIKIGILQYAYERMGVDRRYIFTLLIFSLLGSYFNIPVAELPAERVYSGEVITFFGMQYVIPLMINWPRTVIAVNIGGAVIPVILSIYLMVKNRQYGNSLVAVSLVTFIVHLLAYPVEGLGIAVPTLIPPLASASVALLISRKHAAPLAYIAGSLGTLIGADLLNLNRIRGLGAPIASIGGAGTFDGIFLTGILAVLLASLINEKQDTSSK